ncbi:hypothetical protein [Algoriphagus terrigena]|uniref:hypothetical protein n=1 Tax=Algoriphagus terrigena TaxID=344884 RepID=UPI0012FAD54D|nr:hypothetical protein [Algoriphagus terrigena]
MYKNLYDEKHRYIITTNSDIKNKTNNFELPQSGIHEPNILCKECDNSLLSSFERYFSIFFNSNKIPIEKSPNLISDFDLNGNKFFHCSNADYSKLKLFFLSILWRSSLSNHEFFKEISLGPHEDKIRLMLLNNSPGDVDDYPVMISIVDQAPKSPKDYIGQPTLKKYKGHKIAGFWISSIMFAVVISSHRKPSESLIMSLKPNGEFLLPFVSKSKAWELMLKYSGL